jgi:hypothetical protein
MQAVPDPFTNALISMGAPGIMLGLWIWRDTVRQAKFDEKFDRIIEAMNHLTRAQTIEVLTRPHVADSAKREAQELLAHVTSK